MRVLLLSEVELATTPLRDFTDLHGARSSHRRDSPAGVEPALDQRRTGTLAAAPQSMRYPSREKHVTSIRVARCENLPG